MSSPRQPPPLPLMAELAPLPRTQVGPFLILGVAKDADKEAIEAGWAQRLIWSRKNLIQIPLEDINWAREMLQDPVRRLQADTASLNLDTTEGTLRRIQQKMSPSGEEGRRGGLPIDVEKDLANFLPPTPLPSLEELRSAIVLPELPLDVPVIPFLLDQFISQPLDPWDFGKDQADSPPPPSAGPSTQPPLPSDGDKS